MKTMCFKSALNEEIFQEPSVRARLDGVINPGNDDVYPYHMDPFGLKEVQDEMDHRFQQLKKYPWLNEVLAYRPSWRGLPQSVPELQRFYLQVIDWTREEKVPYLGICAGA